ncbi:MAG: hypothetical protein ACLRSW_01670 [Christensenellaceae bacterium]
MQIRPVFPENLQVMTIVDPDKNKLKEGRSCTACPKGIALKAWRSSLKNARIRQRRTA